MATELELLRRDLSRLETRRHALEPMAKHYAGTPATAFLSESSRKKLENRLMGMSINWPRLLVSSYVDRLRLSGFTLETEADAGVWEAFTRAGLIAGSELVHTDRLTYGAAYLTVIPEAGGGVAAVPDSPRTMTADVDPLSGRCRRSVRYWTHNDKGHALVITPEAVTRWETPTVDAGSAGEWTRVDEQGSPFADTGLHPTVPFIRRMAGDDHDGTSVAADILDLTDAGNKLMGDAMVTSEDYARPRRWATGLEIEEDEDGNMVDPFDRGRGLQSEDPGTKFGQFAPASLEAYSNMIATVTQLIGALSGLPPHYLGLAGDQATSSEGVRATESQLTMRVYSEIRSLNGPWSDVATRLDLAANLERTDPRQFAPAWESPEIRTPGMASDAAAKLHGIGVPLRHLLTDPLGYDPERADAIMRDRSTELVDRAAAEMSARIGRR